MVSFILSVVVLKLVGNLICHLFLRKVFLCLVDLSLRVEFLAGSDSSINALLGCQRLHLIVDCEWLVLRKFRRCQHFHIVFLAIQWAAFQYL